MIFFSLSLYVIPLDNLSIPEVNRNLRPVNLIFLLPAEKACNHSLPLILKVIFHEFIDGDVQITCDLKHMVTSSPIRLVSRPSQISLGNKEGGPGHYAGDNDVW